MPATTVNWITSTLPARGLDDGFDQSASDTAASRFGPDIHADEVPFVGHLGALKDDERGDADEPFGAEGAVHLRAAEPLGEKTQRLGAFRLERAREGVGGELERLQPDVAEQHGVIRGEPAHRDVCRIHDAAPANRRGEAPRRPTALIAEPSSRHEDDIADQR